MSGHSKWANIKHKKERADKKKGKIFSRLAKEIITAVKSGGADIKNNSRLRSVLQKAKAANLSNDVIERNIKKGSSSDQSDYFEMTYELYGYGGVAIIVEIMTDNKNRIASDIRIVINKSGGTVAAPGACSYNFDRKGIIHVEKNQAIEEELFLMATECGAEDFIADELEYLVVTLPENLHVVRECLEKKHIPISEASLEMIPKSYVECSEEDMELNMNLIERLEGIDDVDAVYHNMKI
ncbi:MAG: YebC/PmpR family DNA-binding transcriptional regulator [Parachlamydiales bacterium]|nr:YebC/PmpR family DNA-binding transcriptional regulator [Parachlamydiales bacterium]